MPTPSPQALEVSRALEAQVSEAIRLHGGWIPFDAFMERVLYTPGLGYYSNATRKFGAQGDFITAPMLGPTLAQAIVRQASQWQAAANLPLHWLEFGAGNGQLAADILRLSLSSKQQCLDGVRYYILELSADLAALQRETIARLVPQALESVVWLSQLPENFEGVIIGNEVLDAMPVKIVERCGTGPQEWLEWGVALEGANGQIVERSAPASAAVQQAANAVETYLGRALAPGYRSEISLSAVAWMREVSTCLKKGALLLLDYGFDAQQFYAPERVSGTLMCHYRHHAHTNALWHVGLQDITAHVDFSAIWSAATQAGLELLGYANQANFLMNCDALVASEDDDALSRARHHQAIFKLTSESEMGELFKVIAFGTKTVADVPALGFRRGERSGWL
jgi:SAM-dependent MidA family methyltransferase